MEDPIDSGTMKVNYVPEQDEGEQTVSKEEYQVTTND